MSDHETPDLLDAATAMRLLEEVVAAKGEDYVYVPRSSDGACTYLHGRKPGCIVGHVLIRHGVPVEVIRKWEDRSADSLYHGGGLPNAATLTPLTDEPTAVILQQAQEIQDQGKPWGEALLKARGMYERLQGVS